ncbi:MAG: type II toxin-antitoxin system HicB family antitoxin [Acidobacteria bacterium]|nr:type II toxin-antitoxin system HicB family antitoxin [Acidobacteriota bacterium]
MKFNAMLQPQPEGGFTVTFPDLPWGVTQGETIRESLDMAADVVAMVVRDLMLNGENIPQQRARRGRHLHSVTLPWMSSAKVALYVELRKQGMRKAELARRIGIPKQHVDRLLDLNHSSRGGLIDKAFRVLGKRLEIQVTDAAA